MLWEGRGSKEGIGKEDALRKEVSKRGAEKVKDGRGERQAERAGTRKGGNRGESGRGANRERNGDGLSGSEGQMIEVIMPCFCLFLHDR